MLFITFKLGDERYALEAERIVEVLPRVDLQKVLRAPAGIAGTLNYHGEFVPVLDLSQMILGRPAPSRLSTRILVARVKGDQDFRLLGIIAENVTETMRCDPSDFVSPGIVSSEAPFLGSVHVGERGSIQRVDVDHLLPREERDYLFEPPAAA